MKKTLLCAAAALCALACATSVTAVPAAVMDSPSQVQISPSGARISVESILPLSKGDGRESVSILLPAEAKDMVFDVPGYTIIDWRIENQRLDPEAAGGGVSGKRAALIREKIEVDSEIRALQSRLSAWSLPASNPLPSDEMERRDARLAKIVPELSRELLELNNRSEALRKDLEALPRTAEMGKKVTINLLPAAGSAQDTAVARCSYTLDNCGWKPLYRFDAHPDAGNIGVSLVAEIWQYSGIDWQKSHITLVSQGGGRIAPGGLRPWPVRIHEPEGGMLMPAAPAPRMKAAAEGATMAPPKPALPPQTEGTAFSYWDLGVKNMVEGATRLNLREESWDASVEWLGRPSVSNVAWLRVKHSPDARQYWPVGQAVFSIDGHAVGSGAFTLEDGVAELFFGPDPRVRLSMERKARLGDKKGIIDRRKTMDWAWEIIVTNSRSKDVRIRIEEPAPAPDDKSISVSYTGAPTPREDKEHTLFWDVDVPAGGAFTINHGVNVSVPADADLKSGR